MYSSTAVVGSTGKGGANQEAQGGCSRPDITADNNVLTPELLLHWLQHVSVSNRSLVVVVVVVVLLLLSGGASP
jgi:hypothetical protein